MKMRKRKGLKITKKVTHFQDTIVAVHQLKNCFVIFTKHNVYVYGTEKEVNKFMIETTIKERREK